MGEEKQGKEYSKWVIKFLGACSLPLSSISSGGLDSAPGRSSAGFPINWLCGWSAGRVGSACTFGEDDGGRDRSNPGSDGLESVLELVFGQPYWAEGDLSSAVFGLEGVCYICDKSVAGLVEGHLGNDDGFGNPKEEALLGFLSRDLVQECIQESVRV